MNMKIKLLFSFFLIIISISKANQPVSGKINKEKCGTIRYTDYLKSNSSLLEQQIIDDENNLQSLLNNSTYSASFNTVYTIPVVVHVVYYTSQQNISDAQIQSQIDVLNEDFGRTNADASNTPMPFLTFASSTNFQFCLAQRDPNGDPTNGIERRQTNVQVFQPDNAVKFYNSGGLNAWDVNKYLNIWVCDLGGEILGFAESPSSIHSNNFGVVIQYDAFGRTGVVVPPYHRGRTCTHEISHSFNLDHIWGDEDLCAGSDNVTDTPNQAEATYGCHSFPYAEICTQNYPGIMYMNYMDYSDDDCMNMFTNNQATRMFTSINAFYPTLLTSNGCLPVGMETISDFTFKIYPIPTSGFIDVDLTHTKYLGTKTNIRITDVPGKVVYESLLFNPGNYIHRLDLQQLHDGIYFVVISNDRFKKTEKIILNQYD